MRHHRRPPDPHGPVPEKDFLEGHALLHGVTHDDPKQLRALMLDMLDDAFPFHPEAPERILLRLGALSEVWRHPVMLAWRVTAGHIALGEAALRVAAAHPLTRDGWFDPDSFFTQMLRRMDSEGRA